MNYKICKHKFKTANKYVEDKNKEGWDTYVVLSTPMINSFRDKLIEVGVTWEFQPDYYQNFIYIRGVEKEINSFIELVHEECENFNCEVKNVNSSLVCDPECDECKNELDLLNGKIKYVKCTNKRLKAMTSIAARSKKLKGHAEEKKFANKIKGITVPGNEKKQDVLSKNGELKLSLKSYVKKYQIFLHSKKHFNNNFGSFYELAPYFKKCILSFPETRNEYKLDEQKYKENFTLAIVELKKMIENNLESFLDISFFGEDCDGVALKNGDNYWYVFERYELLECLSNSIYIDISEGGQKVIFQADIGIKSKTRVSVGEIEMRHDPSNYGRLKFWMAGPKMNNPVLRLLKRNINGRCILLDKKIISEEKIVSGIILCGKALKFKKDLELVEETE